MPEEGRSLTIDDVILLKDMAICARKMQYVKCIAYDTTIYY